MYILHLALKTVAIEDQGPTDRLMTFNLDVWTLTLISDLDIQSQDSYDHDSTHAKNQGERSLGS